jgi:hypothetical protein
VTASPVGDDAAEAMDADPVGTAATLPVTETAAGDGAHSVTAAMD